MYRFAARSALLPGIAGASVALLVGAAAMHPTSAEAATGAPAATHVVAGSGSYDLHVASFNISGILNDGGAPYKWASRRSKVAHELLGQIGTPGPMPDVVALQEANTTQKLRYDRTQYTDLVAYMNLYAGSAATYASINDYSMSTRITYNSDTLAMVDHGVLEWDDQETKVDGKRYMPWAIFQVKSTGDTFFFGSDHLETASEPIRRAQWRQLLRDVPHLSQGLPTVFAGDFNSPRGSSTGTPANPTASVMLPATNAAGYQDTMGQVGARLAYVSEAPGAPNVTNGSFNSLNKYKRNLAHYPGKGDRTVVGQSIDYIFASDNLRVKSWAMVFDASKTGADTWTLNGVIPSDHNQIRATITIP